MLIKNSVGTFRGQKSLHESGSAPRHCREKPLFGKFQTIFSKLKLLFFCRIAVILDVLPDNESCLAHVIKDVVLKWCLVEVLRDFHHRLEVEA